MRGKFRLVIHRYPGYIPLYELQEWSDIKQIWYVTYCGNKSRVENHINTRKIQLSETIECKHEE